MKNAAQINGIRYLKKRFLFMSAQENGYRQYIALKYLGPLISMVGDSVTKRYTTE